MTSRSIRVQQVVVPFRQQLQQGQGHQQCGQRSPGSLAAVQLPLRRGLVTLQHEQTPCCPTGLQHHCTAQRSTTVCSEYWFQGDFVYNETYQVHITARQQCTQTAAVRIHQQMTRCCCKLDAGA